MKKLGFIGMGNMAKALAKGFINTGKIKENAIFAYAPNQEKQMMDLITRVQEYVQIDSVYFQCYHEKIISIIQRCGHRFTLHWRKTLLKQMGNLR